MDVCRICLTDEPTKYLHQLQTRDSNGHRDYVQILRFCLEIKFTADSKIKKLCTKCYKKILIFHKFKSMALKNHAYLKSIEDKTQDIDYYEKKVNNIEKVEIETDNKQIRVPYNVHTDDRDKDVKNEIFYIEEDLVIIPHPDDDLHSTEDPENHTIVFSEHNNQQDDSENYVDEDSTQVDESRNYVDEDNTQVDESRNYVDEDNTQVDESIPKCENMKHSKIVEVKEQDVTQSQEWLRRRDKQPNTKIKHCNVCNKDVADLAGHILRMHRRELCKYMCKLCGRRFTSPSLLDLHSCEKAKNLPRPFKCEICQRQYLNQKVLRCHMYYTHPKEKPYMCQFCSKTFLTNHRLDRHIRIHTNEKPFKCPICEKCFAHHAGLYRHKFLHKKEKTFHCTQCDKSYFNSCGLRNHMEYHKKEKDIPCRFCGALFLRYSQRATHEYKVHNSGKGRRVKDGAGGKAPGAAGSGPGATASGSKATNKTAKATRSRGETYLCQLCPMTFTRKSQLTFHLKYHGQERPHKCSECAKSYLTTKGLEYHYQFAHTDSKQFQCQLCVKNFSSPKYLRQHMVAHREDKAKFHCKYCGVSFSREIACKSHQKRVHKATQEQDKTQQDFYFAASASNDIIP